MRHITSGRLSLAMSGLALVIAMAGTSYAAISVGTNNIKNNAVTSAKIKNNTVSGKDVKESSLGTVPSASKAGSATTVNGVALVPVRFVANGGAGSATLYAANGLTIQVSCAASDITLTASSGADNGSIYVWAGNAATPAAPALSQQADSAFDTLDTQNLLAGTDGNTTHTEFLYHSASGKVVTGNLFTDEGTPDCQVTGYLTTT